MSISKSASCIQQSLNNQSIDPMIAKQLLHGCISSPCLNPAGQDTPESLQSVKCNFERQQRLETKRKKMCNGTAHGKVQRKRCGSSPGSNGRRRLRQRKLRAGSMPMLYGPFSPSLADQLLQNRPASKAARARQELPVTQDVLSPRKLAACQVHAPSCLATTQSFLCVFLPDYRVCSL